MELGCTASPAPEKNYQSLCTHVHTRNRIVMTFCVEVEVPDATTRANFGDQNLLGRAGIEFYACPFTSIVVLKTLRHYSVPVCHGSVCKHPKDAERQRKRRNTAKQQNTTKHGEIQRRVDPLVSGWYWLARICLILNWKRKCCISSDINSVPWSDRISSGKPKWEKIWAQALATSSAV